MLKKMKKIYRSASDFYEVTPTTPQCESFDEESWQPSKTSLSSDSTPVLTRSSAPSTPSLSRSEVRASKAKRVKTYLKRCKNALGSKTSSVDQPDETQEDRSSVEKSSWYLDDPEPTGNNLEKDNSDGIKLESSNNEEDTSEKLLESQITYNSKSKSTNSTDCNLLVHQGEVHELEDIFEDAQDLIPGLDQTLGTSDTLGSTSSNAKTASSVSMLAESTTASEYGEVMTVDDFAEFEDCGGVSLLELVEDTVVIEEESVKLNEEIMEVSTSPFLRNQQELVDGIETERTVVSDEDKDDKDNDKEIEVAVEDTANFMIRPDVASLVDKYFGELYPNFSNTRTSLIRQARNLLVCEYHGCLQRFEEDFCEPANILLHRIKNENSLDTATKPRGWPLSLGHSGIVVHLGNLCPTLLRHLDGYLCIRKASTEAVVNSSNASGHNTLKNSSPQVSKSVSNGVELALVYSDHGRIRGKTLVSKCPSISKSKDESAVINMDMDKVSVECSDGTELLQMLQNLLVSIEHEIKRVPVDDLTFPCAHCLDYMPLESDDEEDTGTSYDGALCSCQCSSAVPNNSLSSLSSQCTMPLNSPKRNANSSSAASSQNSAMFDFASSIPHIDSDEDDEGNKDVSAKNENGSTKLPQELLIPTRIIDIPEKLLMSGINLPGTSDIDGRPVILCYAECIARSGLNKYEIARLLLYYNTIPGLDSLLDGFTILLLAESDQDNRVLELIDKAAILLTNHVRITRIIVWRPGINPQHKSLSSRVQAVVVSDDHTLEHYISRDQTPATCITIPHSTSSHSASAIPPPPPAQLPPPHDQLEWVEFRRQLEPFLGSCRRVGRTLLVHLAQLRREETATMAAMTAGHNNQPLGGHASAVAGIAVSRRVLSQQCRQISMALQAAQVLRDNGAGTIKNLEERAQWLGASSDVKRGVQLARDSFAVTSRVAKRMEQLAQERGDRLRDLRKFKLLKEAATELNTWVSTTGEEKLNKQLIQLRTAVDLVEVKGIEKEFENFYFDAMRQIDKSNDLIDECHSLRDFSAHKFKEAAEQLKICTKTFSERLEQLREQIEDGGRCFELLENSAFEGNASYQTPERSTTEELAVCDDFEKLAVKSGVEKLIQLSNQPRDRDKSSAPTLHNQPQTILATSTPLKKQLAGRRSSVSSQAFIYKCNHFAEGVSCTCSTDSDSEQQNTVSYKLKKKFIQLDTTISSSSSPTSNSNSNNNSSSSQSANTLERKPSVTLDGIKEVRESVEDLLETDSSSDLVGTDNSDVKLPVTDDSDVKLTAGSLNLNSCDSGVSTGDNSVGDDSSAVGVGIKCVRRSVGGSDHHHEGNNRCGCHQYYGGVSCTSGSSSSESCQDNGELMLIRDGRDGSCEDNGSEGFGAKSDDLEDDHFSNRKVLPIPSNSHLHCHSSIIDLPTDSFDGSTDSKTQKTLRYIMREMIQTERDYVQSLDYIIVNYLPELTRDDIPQVLRGQRNVVFGNVEKIYEFHSRHFLKELVQYEDCPLLVGGIFLKYQARFALYALYNKNKPKSDALMSEFGSKFFKSKQLQLEDRMDLASYLLKPVQRMGKYALLLQQMMKACPDLTATSLSSSTSERAWAEQDRIREAEEMVRFQLRHGNDLLAMDSIRECDVNLKEQGALIRQNEFMVMEGRNAKKTMRQVFLFEDLILFSKARRLPDRKNLDLYIYKSSIKTSDIGLTAKIGDSSTRFEIWFRKRKPNDTFILQASSEEVKKTWTEELSQLLWKQAIKNREVRQQEMSSMGIGNKPCLEIRPSANQINDRSISYDQLSKTAPRFRNSIVCTSTMSGCLSLSPITTSTTANNTNNTNNSAAAANNNNTVVGNNVMMMRPHSVISMSSVSGSSSSNGSSSGGNYNNLYDSCAVVTAAVNNNSGGNYNNLYDSCAVVTAAVNNNSNNENNNSGGGGALSPQMCGGGGRSGTLNSQCSIESGIIADMSHDDIHSIHWPLEKSQSLQSAGSNLPQAAAVQQTANTGYDLDEEIPIHI